MLTLLYGPRTTVGSSVSNTLISQPSGNSTSSKWTRIPCAPSARRVVHHTREPSASTDHPPSDAGAADPRAVMRFGSWRTTPIRNAFSPAATASASSAASVCKSSASSTIWGSHSHCPAAKECGSDGKAFGTIAIGRTADGTEIPDSPAPLLRTTDSVTSPTTPFPIHHRIFICLPFPRRHSTCPSLNFPASETNRFA